MDADAVNAIQLEAVMEVLDKGTVEALIVALRDRLDNVTDLSTVSNRFFDVRRKEDDSPVQTNVAWTIDADFPMSAICEIDTTLPAYVAGDTYKLYLKYTSGSESPVKGPLYFRVEDD
jgi:hypothetical protein